MPCMCTVLVCESVVNGHKPTMENLHTWNMLQNMIYYLNNEPNQNMCIMKKKTIQFCFIGNYSFISTDIEMKKIRQ